MTPNDPTPTPPSTPSGIQFEELRPPPIPDHELIRCIGQGSYGEVWLARNVMGTYRAVKIVHRIRFQDERPFDREYNGIQRFEPVSRSHESQVDILHIGRHNGCFYYVMELADDEDRGQEIDPDSYAPKNLRTVVERQGRLSADETLEIALALTTALEHLHSHGLVHRDIKPSNIIFVHGIPKLADIGLVTSADATRSFVGTEGFLPPEGPGTARADIYSLGKVLYELCTGRDRKDYPELPTMLDELEDRERLLELNAIIAKACREDVRERYASAEAMRQDLLLMQSGKSVRRMQRLERRLGQVRRLGTTALVISLLGIGVYSLQRSLNAETRRLAGENLRLAEERRQQADVVQLALQEAQVARASEEALTRKLESILRARANAAPAIGSGTVGIEDGTAFITRLVGNASITHVPAEVLQMYLTLNRTNAASVLAVQRVRNDPPEIVLQALREAAVRFPDHPHVLYIAVALDLFPEERRSWLEAFGSADPDNALPWYLAARVEMKEGKWPAAVERLREAVRLAQLKDYAVERIQEVEEIYLLEGRSPAEAKAVAATSCILPHLSLLRDLGREIATQQAIYCASGDCSSAEALAQLGTSLGRELTSGSGAKFLINQLAGLEIELMMIEHLDAHRRYEWLNGTPTERAGELVAQKSAIEQLNKNFAETLMAAIPSEAQLNALVFFDRLKLYGESSAIQWLEQRSNESQPTPQR